MKFKSIKNLSTDIFEKIIPILPRDIGIVYGIPRSGMLPASIISTSLGAKLGVLGHDGHFGARGKNIILPMGEKALLVDDSIHKGGAMSRAKEILNIYNLQYYTCAIYAHSKSVHNIDFYAEIIDNGRIFQWNFSGIKATKDFSWDMDGVICTNPKVYDNDGIEYQFEILNGVKPLHLPQVKIHSIVTNRIERWRPETTKWLNKYGVRYNNLIMQPYKSAIDRRKYSTPSEFKAKKFKKSNSTIFIESDEQQARIIAELSNKPVLSIETMELHGG